MNNQKPAKKGVGALIVLFAVLGFAIPMASFFAFVLRIKIPGPMVVNQLSTLIVFFVVGLLGLLVALIGGLVLGKQFGKSVTMITLFTNGFLALIYIIINFEKIFKVAPRAFSDIGKFFGM